MENTRHQVTKNGSRSAVRSQAKMVLLTTKRIPLGKSGVRLQFYKAETGKKWIFVDLKTELMAMIDQCAKREKTNAGHLILHAMDVLFQLQEKMQRQGRAA